MKRVLMVALAIALIISLFGCGGTSTDKMVGTWEGEYDVMVGGMSFHERIVVELQNNDEEPIYTFAYKEYASGTMSNVMTGSWKVDGEQLVLTGTELNGNKTDYELTYEIESGKLYSKDYGYYLKKQ